MPALVGAGGVRRTFRARVASIARCHARTISRSPSRRCCAAPKPPAGCGPANSRPGGYGSSLDCPYASLSLESPTKAACGTACATGGYAFCSYDAADEYCYGHKENKKGGCSSYDDVTSKTTRWSSCKAGARARCVCNRLLLACLLA
jgi:hypothetical protein